ncbi:MAG: Smr/MutS family protein [Bacteroidales bacterium]|nr:Smr/MutS family protein [Bacteroidales bacterium]
MENKLGFNKIREIVASATTNALAYRMAQEMTFGNKAERIVRELRQTEEFRQILLMENSFPSQDFYDLSEELERLKIGNTIIDPAALVDMKTSLQAITDCLLFLLRDDQERYPTLRALAEKVELDPQVLRRLNKIVDDKGEIYDDASPALKEIRQQMVRKRGEVDTLINKTLNHAKKEGWAPKEAEATIRNGRLVIPMLDTHRRKIKGLIHDESATRQTAYLEPSEVVELNNDLRELEFDERHEIQRILLQLSDYIRPQITELVNAYWFLAKIDFIRAKARFALAIGGVMPIVNDRPMLNWLSARHPLLYLSYNKPGGEKKEVVPFDMELNDEKHILVISGPNAGGKSVCLKAVGLIQYMLQCGLLVPCRETSEFGLFDRIFVDIGDQQSIENDLSTYTSHLQNMKALLAEADERTLFLLDELGGGTEPRSGCAIAEALLEELHRRHAFGVVTTHFADLKLLADSHPGIENGAMLFDTERMVPLYRLATGHPGSSFAFEIATNIGFPLDILEAAEKKVGTEMLNFEHQLQQIELEKEALAKQRSELEASDSFLNEVIQKYQALNEKLESRRYELLSQARKEAQDIIANANRTVERTIADIKEANAEREKTLQAREAMRQEAEKIVLEQEKHNRQREKSKKSVHAAAAQHTDRQGATPQQPESDLAEGPLAVGDIVRIDGEDTFGQLIEIKGKKGVVESNSLRMTIALERLVKTRKKVIPTDKTARQGNRFQSIFDDINEKRKHFNPTLDLRGYRAEEAMSELQHFLDDAKLLSEKELRILHGKGYGILKTLLRQQLQRDNDVESYHSERIELGGDGITVVHLR